jgi:hypothetical protein
MLHRINCDRGVELPWNCEVNQVYIGKFAELFVAFGAAELILSAGSAELLEDALGPVDTILIEIAKGYDSRVLEIREAPDCAGSTVAKADEAHADVFDRLRGESEHRLLVCRTGGGIVNDLVTFDLVTIIVRTVT